MTSRYGFTFVQAPCQICGGGHAAILEGVVVEGNGVINPGRYVCPMSTSPNISQTAWRPIETAPRDGTIVDLLIDGQRLPNCYWSDVAESAEGRCDGAWVHKRSDIPVEWHPYDDGERSAPSHWLPIPIGPSTAQAAEDNDGR